MAGKETWDLEADVVVLGSGGSALTAAILAHDGGAETVVLEKAPVVGGTTAMSGGMLWIPNNHHQRELEIPDSRDEILKYMHAYSGGVTDEALLEAFVDTGPEMVQYMEEHTPARFETHELFPDYQPELPGGKAGGRSLDSSLFSFKRLGEWADRVNASLGLTFAMTLGEAARRRGKLSREEMETRVAQDMRAAGNALIGALLLGCLERKLPIHLETRGRELIFGNDAVVGVRAERDGAPFLVRARKAVILASGGFEWNRQLVKAFLRGPMTGPGSNPENEGDGLLMAMAAGASLHLMSEAWWMPTIRIPGWEMRGKEVYKLAAGNERAYPGAIIVNREGKRFVNEACNYNTFGRVFHEFETNSTVFGTKNLPCWLVFDQRYREGYDLIGRGTLVPDWMYSGKTLREVAEKAGIAASGLEETVERFNGFAREGHDPDFHRGESAYDRYMGDRDEEDASATLGPVEISPFYAVELHSGTIGTKGGPKTNARAQVLNAWDEVIPGLYAVGNTMASATGLAYWGAGGTIGPGMTFGYIAGRHLGGQ